MDINMAYEKLMKKIEEENKKCMQKIKIQQERQFTCILEYVDKLNIEEAEKNYLKSSFEYFFNCNR